MFEAVELGRKISKEDYQQQLPVLRTRLIEVQQAARQAGLPVVVVVCGVDGAGKGTVVHRLNEWLDPRGIDTHTLWKLTREEKEYPPYWRYWRTLPARGRIGIDYGAWYDGLLPARLRGRMDDTRLEYQLARIAAFERMLVEDGTRIVKLWFHLARREQLRRFRRRSRAPHELQRALPHARKLLRHDRELPRLQLEVNRLAGKAHRRGVSSVLVFEGWDAAGKGSAIRRVTEAVDARLFRVVPVAAPTEDERAHHYLWRFWRQLPRAGRVAIFDRSWYGRVLVERLEGFAARAEWMRAYHEINEFEKQLTEHGMVVVKYWIHISREEQLRRFRKREEVAHKKYKITAEDWRNRKRWGAYEQAGHDMVAHTGTEHAPWHLVAGNDKEYARLEVVRRFRDALRRAL